jgi:hypothetical protein
LIVRLDLAFGFLLVVNGVDGNKTIPNDQHLRSFDVELYLIYVMHYFTLWDNLKQCIYDRTTYAVVRWTATIPLIIFHLNRGMLLVTADPIRVRHRMLKHTTSVRHESNAIPKLCAAFSLPRGVSFTRASKVYVKSTVNSSPMSDFQAYINIATCIEATGGRTAAYPIKIKNLISVSSAYIPDNVNIC